MADETLTSRQMLKGTGDVLKDLDRAERLTDTSEPGFGEVVCRGRQLDFVNRTLRVARGEIRQLRERLAAKLTPPEGKALTRLERYDAIAMIKQIGVEAAWCLSHATTTEHLREGLDRTVREAQQAISHLSPIDSRLSAKEG